MRRSTSRRFSKGLMAGVALALLLPTAVLAEERPAEDPVVATEPDDGGSADPGADPGPAGDPAPEPESPSELEPEPAPEPEPEPVPAPVEPTAPVDDPDPVGGWAVIDPATGRVVNAVVCRESVCGVDGEWGGVLPGDTDCPGCILRKQTNGMADGNVAGWRSSDDMDVVYDGDETGTFTIVTRGATADGGRTTTVEKLDPARTATDPDRMDLRTGIVERSTEGRFVEDDQRARVAVQESRPESGELVTDGVDVEFGDWGRDFAYGSAQDAASSLESDVDSALVAEGLLEEPADESAQEAASDAEAAAPEDVEASEPNPVVRAIRSLARRVVSFLSGWFGG